MKKLFFSLALFTLAFVALSANAFAQQAVFVDGFKTYTPAIPGLVVYGFGASSYTSAVKSTTFQCDPRYFPTLPIQPDNTKGDWPTCWVYPIVSPDTCEPVLFGGKGVGLAYDFALRISSSWGWLSYWCPAPGIPGPVKALPVVLACTGNADCITSLKKVLDAKTKGFAGAVKDAVTTSVTSPEMLPIWSGPDPVRLIFGGRP
jgi:hypothetical protein